MKFYMQIPMKRIQKGHRRHFQLLELMVAVFILLICIVPAMRVFTSIYQSQQAIIRENQRDHLAHLVHANITEKLYKNQIPFGKEIESEVIALTDPELTELLQKFSYHCEGTLEIMRSYIPQGQELPTKYLGKLTIKMKDITFQKKRKTHKKFGNENSSETFYDYFVYIDAGEMEKKGGKKETTQDKKNEENVLKKPSSSSDREEI